MSLPGYAERGRNEVLAASVIPTHWRIHPLKRIVLRVESGVSVNALDSPAMESDLGVLKTSCVYRGMFDPAENKTVVPEECGRVACPVTKDTLIVSRMNTPALVGAAGVVKESLKNIFLPDRLWQVHLDGALPAFVHYWTLTPLYRAQVAMACAGTSESMQNLSKEDFLSFVVPLPDVSEQGAIVTFLDCETTKIAALIAEQEKLIALLAEKRQATISHAVTRGLTPNVPTKDSGIAWVGQVPAHWEVTQIKRLCEEITDGAHISPETLEGVYPFVSTKDVGQHGIDFEDCLLTSAPSYDYMVRTGCRPQLGDILFSKDGTIGRTTIVVDDREFVVASSLIIIRPDRELLLPEFLDFLCRSALVAAQVEAFVKGAGLPRLSIQNLLKVIGVFPPIPEQREIAACLSQEIGKLHDLEHGAEQAIALLRERRSALITAAVTGQIDVRGVVPTPDMEVTA